ncbi:MAG TPA: hypothetical protein DET40_23360 [Lentisphaeria bacterium]|nr:MAG: hypothetical protein A2X45_24565 [Lentisphaerae bacterium GWF2_50_93]HCE46494.1 hypothetical protein [Lentisphaeria bacterium]
MNRTMSAVILFSMLGLTSCNDTISQKTSPTPSSEQKTSLPPPVQKVRRPALAIGSLQMKKERMAADRQAGMTVHLLSVIWGRMEPQEGKFSSEESDRVRSEIAAARAAGFEISVDFGLQYPPEWVFKNPDSHYRNQYGDEYAGDKPGCNGYNTVFVQANRERVERFVKHFFQEFGTDFQSIRLGWGYYGELNYPIHRFKPRMPADAQERTNCYWSFDDIAQGRKPGLAAGISKYPVPGWKPGDPSPNGEAKQFLEWYLGAMQNFHDWQIRFLRSQYAGRLCMMYPSWGIRPGWLDAAIAGNLNGKTSPEKNGEIQRGFDFSRFISGIADPHVVVYCTWIDAKTLPADADQKANVNSWSPVRYLSQLARDHQPKLEIWGENTGPGVKEQLGISFQRARDNGLLGVMWAFDPQLHDGAPGNATLEEFSAEIRKWEKSGTAAK